jgi:hypothetical protein
VKKAIDAMVSQLLTEKADEIKHKDFCVDEFLLFVDGHLILFFCANLTGLHTWFLAYMAGGAF